MFIWCVCVCACVFVFAAFYTSLFFSFKRLTVHFNQDTKWPCSLMPELLFKLPFSCFLCPLKQFCTRNVTRQWILGEHGVTKDVQTLQGGGSPAGLYGASPSPLGRCYVPAWNRNTEPRCESSKHLPKIFHKKGRRVLNFKKPIIFLTLQFFRCSPYGNSLLSATGSNHTKDHHTVAPLSQPNAGHRGTADTRVEWWTLALEFLYQFPWHLTARSQRTATPQTHSL